MTDKLSELTMFFPFWNEEKNIHEVVKRAIEIIPTVADTYEILLIDDGSSDDTLKLANELAQKYPFIRVIAHRINRGYGAALRSGFGLARRTAVFFGGVAAAAV